MGGRHGHLIDEKQEEEEDDDDVYMYPADMTLDERAEFQATYRGSKASE